MDGCMGGLSSTITSVQHPLGWFEGCHRTTAPVRSPHTSYRWRGERVIEQNKWMGIIRRPWLTRASGGNLARTPGLHPTHYEKCHGIFNDHRESGPQFNVSSERPILHICHLNLKMTKHERFLLMFCLLEVKRVIACSWYKEESPGMSQWIKGMTSWLALEKITYFFINKLYFGPSGKCSMTFWRI